MIFLAAFGLWYAVVTAIVASHQALENLNAVRGDPYWAPVWWVALTWPYWVFVLPLRRGRK